MDWQWDPGHESSLYNKAHWRQSCKGVADKDDVAHLLILRVATQFSRELLPWSTCQDFTSY
jgi:hypothetical protein